MKTSSIVAAAMALGALATPRAEASAFSFGFQGPGVSGSITFTYGASTDATYPQAFELTGISGTFSDSNHGLNVVDATIGSLVAVTHATPEPTNHLAPHDFSRFAVAAGLPADNGGFLTYDNLYYPGGSPQTASDYPVSGGFLDIYGLMFDIGGGRYVDVWSNGSTGGAADYGVALATTAVALDYVGGGVVAVPEPSTFALLLAGLSVMCLAGRRRPRDGG